MNTVNINKKDIVTLLGLSKYCKVKLVENKHSRIDFLTETITSVFGTDINIEATFEKVKKGLFKTKFKLCQYKITIGDGLIYLGQYFPNDFNGDISLDDDTTHPIPNEAVKNCDYVYFGEILEEMKEVTNG